MKKQTENIIIETLTFRFLQEYVNSVPVYSKESLQRVLRGYDVLGMGFFSVSLYNDELRKKHESQIILLSQDVGKEIMAYIHMLYPKNHHFPALNLLAKSNYFPSNIEIPLNQREEDPVYVYCIPEYESLIFDKKNKKWYRVASEKLEDKGRTLRVTKNDMKPILKERNKKVIQQIDFIMSFAREAYTLQSVGKNVYVDSKKSLDILSNIKANRNQQSIKNAIKILIDEIIKLNRSKKFNFFWDIRTTDILDSEYGSQSSKNTDFFMLHNIAIDKAVSNIILLDAFVSM